MARDIEQPPQAQRATGETASQETVPSQAPVVPVPSGNTSQADTDPAPFLISPASRPTKSPGSSALACGGAERVKERNKAANARRRSADRRNGSAFDALQVHLEHDTARAFQAHCLGGPVDLSHGSWVLTANELDILPAPLRSRPHVAVMEPAGPDALPALVATMRADLAAELDLPAPRLLPGISALQRKMLREDFARHRDPRRLKRAIRSLSALGVTA